MHKKIGIFLAASTCLLIFSHPRAQEVLKFDRDHSGFIDTDDEKIAVARHKASQVYRDADTDFDGKITAKEWAEYNEKLNKSINAEVTRRISDWDEDLADRQRRVNIEALQADLDLEKPKTPSKTLAGIYIRKNPEDITILTGPKDYGKAESAVGSYSRDFRTNSNLWTLKATMAYAIPLVECSLVFAPPKDGTESPDHKKQREADLKTCKSERIIRDDGPTVLSSVLLVPSLTIDRFSNTKDQSKEVDLLSPRFTSEFELAGGKLFGFNSHYLRPSIAYATDSKFKSSVVAAELQWEPIRRDWGMGVFQPIPGGFIDYRIRSIFVAQWSHVFDNGNKKTITKRDSDLRAGVKFGIEFQPPEFKQLGFYANWTYLRGLGSGSDNQSLFEVGTNLKIDPDGHYTIEASYRKGQAPLVKDNIEAFLLGFGVKF